MYHLLTIHSYPEPSESPVSFLIYTVIYSIFIFLSPLFLLLFNKDINGRFGFFAC